MNLWLSSFCGLEPPHLPIKALPMFCPRLTAPCVGAGALRPSCRPLRSSSQTPAAAGSHLYTATTGLRAVGDFVVGVLQTHVGRTLTFRPLGLCPASPCLCLDYSTLLAICQALFLFFFGGQACLSLFSFPPRAVPTLLTRHRVYSAFLRLTTLQAWSVNPRHRGEDLRRLFRLAASLRVFSYPASPSL